MRRTSLPLAAALGAVLILGGGRARGDDVSFGPHDVPTVFFIGTSVDKNRVDYGIRLDADCVPSGNDAVFPYWRLLEHAPPVHTRGLAAMERMPFGLLSQGMSNRTADGAEYYVRLTQFDRMILVTTKKNANGSCSATPRMTIKGKIGLLVSVFAKLAGFAIDYVDVHGKDPANGAALDERIQR